MAKKQVVSETHKTETFADAVVEREHEVFMYSVNKKNYETMLAALPDDPWPESLVRWRGVPIESLPLELDDETVQLISDYQYKDHLRLLIRTETAEMRKSERVLAALEASIPEAGRDAEIDKAIARRELRIAEAKAAGPR